MQPDHHRVKVDWPIYLTGLGLAISGIIIFIVVRWALLGVILIVAGGVALFVAGARVLQRIRA